MTAQISLMRPRPPANQRLPDWQPRHHLLRAPTRDGMTLQHAVADPAHASPQALLALQRAAGNRAVTGLLQAKLTVGPAGDAYEREADQVADQVMAAPQTGPADRPGSTVQRQGEEEEVQTRPLAATVTPLVQRQGEEEEIQTQPLQRAGWGATQETNPEEEEEVQTKPVQRQGEEEEIQTQPLQRAGWGATQETNPEEEEEVQTKPIQRTADGSFTAGREVETQLAATRGMGEPLPAECRNFMERRFGADFGGVRIHTGATAAQLSRDLQAQAFTHGRDIYFGAGRYDPGSEAGQRLLAHELTHTIQQSGGRASVARCTACSGDQLAVQRRLDANLYSRAAFATQGLKAGYRLGGPTSFAQILKALDAYHKTDPADRAQQKKYLDQLLTHCQSWLNSSTRSKKKSSQKQTIEDKKERLIRALMSAARAELVPLAASLDTSLFDNLKPEMLSKLVAGSAPTGTVTDTRTAQEMADAYNTLEAGLATYAKRVTQATASDFATGKTVSQLKRALAMPKTTAGKLSPEAVYMMSVIAAEEAQGYVTGGQTSTAPFSRVNVKKKTGAIQSAMQWKNKVTGETQRPDLKNLLTPTQVVNPDQQVVDTVNVNGITLKVYHSVVDVNYQARLTMFSEAVKKLQSAGFILPGDLFINLPKYGANIDTITECTVSGSTPRAVFAPPNFIHLRADVVGNPIDEMVNSQYKNLSTTLYTEGDTSGTASIVHEMGHMMHYRNSPGKFFSLHGTGWVDKTSSGLAAQVSAYAGGNPREFVAEVFMGLIYGKSFSDEILKMYRDLGGAIPPAMAGKFSSL